MDCSRHLSSARSFAIVAFALVASLFPLAAHATAPCPLDPAQPSVTICAPADGSAVSSPVHILAGANSATPTYVMQLYVDGTKVFESFGDVLDTDVPMASGAHRVSIHAVDNTGAYVKKVEYITVATAPAGNGATTTTGSTSSSCPLDPAQPSVTICTPASGATTTSPVHITALPNSSKPVVDMQVWLDGTKVYEVSANTLDASIPMTPGVHNYAVVAFDNTWAYFQKSSSVTISSPPPAAACPLDPTVPSVTICSPADGATVSSPVHIVAQPNSKNPVVNMQVWLDGAKVYEINSNSLDASIPMSAGFHSFSVVAFDNTWAYFKKSSTVTVGTAATPSSGDISKLKHIIFTLQENRSFDSYFGRLGQYRRDRGFTDPFDGLPLNKVLYDTAGNPISPYHFQTACHDNVSPSWDDVHKDWNNGAMDNFLKTTTTYYSSYDPTGTRPMGYYDWTDLPYYYELAFQFGTSDRFFSSVLGPTIPNRMYMFAATSFGHISPDPPPSGGFTQTTIFDRLDAAGISWRYYYRDNSVFLAQWAVWNRDMSKVYPISYYYTDIQNETTMPQVVFIERPAQTGLDEHPGENNQTGSYEMSKIINALMQSPTWRSSAFILAFDEAGGMYDHVPPATFTKPDSIAPMLGPASMPGDFTQSGFRVPIVVVSPYARKNFVSHKNRELTSILKLIEVRFGLPSLTARDALADDMTEFFDFANPPWLTPPPLPVQPTSGACAYDLERAPGH